jgi:hypothetical protein
MGPAPLVPRQQQWLWSLMHAMRMDRAQVCPKCEDLTMHKGCHWLSTGDYLVLSGCPGHTSAVLPTIRMTEQVVLACPDVQLPAAPYLEESVAL